MGSTAAVGEQPSDGDGAKTELSPVEYEQYDHMAVHMDYYHNHFRQTWNMIYSAASTGKRPRGMSVTQYLDAGAQFCQQIEMHHTIEEQHIFPVLAKKMPAFQKELELLTHHKQIHAGLERFQEYIDACLSRETDLRMGELRRIMDTFKDVLWAHLAAEVNQLRADNMRKYWTLDEMARMPL